ncbi:hypothetical protein DFH09DRAFT_1333495 [Mycena vulgaris]|nr:hypothetical protein DFH09DRAFT_1333495 [Mycena vulgaris]
MTRLRLVDTEYGASGSTLGSRSDGKYKAASFAHRLYSDYRDGFWLSYLKSLLSFLAKKKARKSKSSNAGHTPSNVLQLALEELSRVSSNTLFASDLVPLLETTTEDISVDEQCLLHFIQLLTANISKMTGNTPLETVEAMKQSVFRPLKLTTQLIVHREFRSITKDLSDAHSQGTLAQFFDSTDTSSYLAKHTMKLRQILNAEQNEIFHITGSLGTTGTNGYIGGKGGEGSAPTVEISPHTDSNFRNRNISGGTGGTGGVGVQVGGTGGTGRGPTIRVARRG